MGDWDHMGNFIGNVFWLAGVLGIALVIALPFAIWKVVELIQWLF